MAIDLKGDYILYHHFKNPSLKPIGISAHKNLLSFYCSWSKVWQQ